jgi:hypothetical protein
MTDENIRSGDFLAELENPGFRQWIRVSETEINLLECLLLEDGTNPSDEKEVNAVAYNDKQRSNVLFTLKQSMFDDSGMQDLAADPGTTVEQVLARARRVVQSDSSSSRDVENASYLVKLIRDYATE